MFLLSKKSVGIDIADHTIEVVELSKDGKSLRISGMSSVELHPGIVERGRIKDEPRLAEQVKKALRQATQSPNSSGHESSPILVNNVVLGLPESQVYVHTFNLPPHNKKDRDSLVLKEAQMNIPIERNDLLFSYKVLSSHIDFGASSGQQNNAIADTKDYVHEVEVQILLVATSRKVVLEWQGFFKMLDINIEVFDIESLATFRGLLRGPLEAPVCVVDIGALMTNVAIFDNYGLQHAYTINIAGENLTREIARFLKVDNREAEKLKREIGLSKPGEQVCLILIKVLQPVVADIQTTLNYFKKRTGGGVKEVILVGGSSTLMGLADYFSANLGIPTKVGKQKLLESKIPLVYIESIGLALRGLDGKWGKNDPFISLAQNVDKTDDDIKNNNKFLPRVAPSANCGDQSAGKRLHIQKTILLSLVIIAVIAIPASFWYSSYRKAQQEAQVQAQLEAVDIAIGEQDDLEVEQVLDETASGDETVDDVLNDGLLEVADPPETEERVIITETPTGWLNAREGPGTTYPIITKLSTGGTYILLQEENDWYKIVIPVRGASQSGVGGDEESEAWVISQYASIINN